jgi:hypothetical protein
VKPNAVRFSFKRHARRDNTTQRCDFTHRSKSLHVNPVRNTLVISSAVVIACVVARRRCNTHVWAEIITCDLALLG